ncbi:MAG: M23 family metallopeptidase [Pseudomonadota bacterium]
MDNYKLKIGFIALKENYFLLKYLFFSWKLFPIFIAILLLSGTAFSEQKEVPFKARWFPEKVRQGDIFVVNVLMPNDAHSLTGNFQNKDLSFYKIKNDELFQTLIGIDMETEPGIYKLAIMAKSNSGKTLKGIYNIKINKKDFGEQRISLPKEMVELDQDTLKQIDEENKKLKEIWAIERNDKIWYGKFIKPLNGEIISSFGVRRILNGLPKSPHTGVDLRAGIGEEIRSSNTGIVIFVSEMFFCGKSVIVDHGRGLYTMYFHLSKIDVKEGQRVKKGEILGLVGSSGRSTGPHLHWGVRLHDARVDPISLLKLR